ncbi:uncharacterized protein BDZ99DRAFT_462765 [Mytilinidion resinicola]|uniref:Uncharacterized protein n=1 Tax=Mytilinidion resinicola TaxID=574789 RepID=A0A6A6YMQ2_9PEZI|nr:uncharacterized protein BDZ99DRAFT_462765 [Mytilinidion resinicola]KAF2810166.1 hypothetical protein BDZ99DRAFT_462765 [Mytilinidion resinicola]
MRLSKGPALGPLTALFSILVLLIATAAQAADTGLPDLSTVAAPSGKGASSTQASSAATTSASAAAKTTGGSSVVSSAAASTGSVETFQVTSGPTISSTTTSISVFHLTGLPTIAGAGIPTVIVPDLSKASFMQKSNLPDGTVFICVGAVLGFMGMAILAWRGLVAWSLHRSVKRAAMNQHLAITETKGAYANAGSGTRKSKSFYAAVGASSTMSLDRLSAAPPPHSKPPRPFSSANTSGTPPKPTPSSSLFFSPTAGAGLHSAANRSSSYLPAGYYASGAAQPASGGQTTHVGGAGGPPSSLLSMGPTAAGYSRARSVGISPPGSPSLPPSRGNPYDRPPGSRGESVGYARSSVAGPLGGGVYGHGGLSTSNLSLNLPGGTQAPGGRAPSAYLEDLFENHGNGPRERF